MVYVIRKKSNDYYFNNKTRNFQNELNKDCYLDKEQVKWFKKEMVEYDKDYMDYIIINPKGEI